MRKIAQINIESVFLSGTNKNLSDPSNIGSKFISALLSGAISIAGIILLFLLISGGIGIIAGAGKSDQKSIEQGKKTATSAIIGFVIVFSAYWIVKLVETITGLKLI